MSTQVSPTVGPLVTADPFRCRAWMLNVRMEEDVDEASCRAEIDSVARHGQLVPVIGRKLVDDPQFDIEVICGLRRLFIARHLRMPLRVELRDLTDREAAVAVEAENTLRKPASAYERGLWLARLQRQGIYRSQEQMALELGIAPTRITRLLKFAELPAAILSAFASPHDILESWAVELHKAWSDERRHLLTERARAIQRHVPRPPALSVYEQLLADRAPSGHGSRRALARVLKDPAGAPLLRIERQRREVVLRIPNALIDEAIERTVTESLVSILCQRKYREPTPAA